MHLVLLCATNRGLRVLRRMLELYDGCRFTVVSFREEPEEPPFIDAIRNATEAAGQEFIEARNVGAAKLRSFWENNSVDLIFAVSWRYLVPPDVFLRARRGAFVFHDSLLPKYRGFSPTVWSIANGEDHTGVTLFAMDREVDTGPIIDQLRVPIGPDDVISDIMERVTLGYLELLNRNYAALRRGDQHLREQVHAEATYNRRRTSDDNRIDWTLPSSRIYDLIRAVSKPYSGAFTTLDGRRLRVWEAHRHPDCDLHRAEPGKVAEVIAGRGVVVHTGDHPLLLTKVQFDGQESSHAAHLLNCTNIQLGRETPMNDSISIPFNRATPLGRELEYMAEALQSGETCGDRKYTKKCQERLRQIIGARHALLTTSCTHALEMAAILLNIEPGDEVIVPTFTFVSTACAFVMRGAKIVFGDIRPDTLNLDERRLASLITPRTKAIVVVHYAGVACEMDVILKTAERHGVRVVEDNAHGLFGFYKSRPLGSIGCLATQSFHETKNISCGEGGALVINDPQFVERAEILREKGTNRSRFFRGEVDKYTWVDLGSSYVSSDILAACLFAQFEAADEIQRRRGEIWRRYDQGLAQWAHSNGVTTPFVPRHCEQSYHMYYLLLPNLESRTELIAHLKRRQIMAVFHYIPLHYSDMGRKFGGRVGDCPVAESVCDRLLRLPFYAGLSNAEQQRVIDAVCEFQVSAHGSLPKAA